MKHLWGVILATFLLSGATVAFAGGGEKVTLCHKPDNQAIELTVGDPAVDAHLAHGDTLGSCDTAPPPPPPGDGGGNPPPPPPSGGGGSGGGVVLTGPNEAGVYCDFDHYVVVGVVDGQVADSATPSTIPGTYHGWTNVTLHRGDTDWRSAVFTYGDCVPR